MVKYLSENGDLSPVWEDAVSTLLADGVPFATVRYRPVYSGSSPTVRVHGHTPTPEATRD